ncbi:aldehyde dehydrogenase family protein [Mycoplasmopsis columbina]|uniref:aldehyde dehydrogenase family protein n=1 Tax=Mycoplasmopsis columbina TaxID=114881 RepID=UPI0004A759EE|nr:aldehyde dehydrogenase family protein [Mycoplasmopsis columbina]VEU76927.1 NAD-dependent aldehyde dehydrogenase domain-containing protein [Mycoplasmopsis columbina]
MQTTNVYKLQRKMIEKNKLLSFKERISLLIKLKSLIENNIENIQNALKIDLNKSAYESYLTEIGLVLKELNLAINKLKKWMKPKKVKRNFLTITAKQRIIYEPLGQVLIISPWNYPFYLSIIPLIGALAAGNRVIIKPSEFSQTTSNLLANLINDNLNSEYIFVSKTPLEEVLWLLDQKFDLIFFTGNSNIAKSVAEKAAKNLTPLVLELGGKSPVILDQNINFELVAKKIAQTKLLSNGQTCIGPDYVFVHKKDANLFLNLINNFLQKQLKHSDRAKIISLKHLERIEKIAPKEIIFDKTNCQVEAKAFLASLNDSIMQEEIFAPLLPVIEYENIEDVLNYINHKEKPLSLYLFSKNKKIQKLVAKNTSSGSFVVNDILSQLTNHHLPFGGVGNSGYGRYHGFESFKTFSNPKSIFVNKLFSNPLLEAPFEDWKFKIIKKFLK